MDVLEVAICEDSPEERERLLALIEKADASANCATFTDGESFLGEFRPGKYDLIFMDIYMGGMTGVETVTRLRELDEEVPIAFATTSTEHTLESYRLNVLKYIEKPVGQKAVQEIIQLARLKKESRPHLHFKIDGSEVNIPLDSIIYMEQKGHELLIHVADGEPVRVNEKLDSVEPLLAGQSFYRCHKSYGTSDLIIVIATTTATIWYNKRKSNGGAEYETRNIYRHRIQLPEKENQARRVSGNHG